MNAQPAITEDDLQAYVDGALSPSRRAEVERHLEADPGEARRIEGLTWQRSALRSALAGPAEEPIPSRLDLTRMIGERRRSTVPQHWKVAAAIGLFVIGGAGGWSLHPPTSPWPVGARPLVQEAADAYRVYEPDRMHPVEIAATDRDALARWVSSRLQRSISVPDSASAYELMGGRVVVTSRGPAAMFMYDRNGTDRIVMLVCPLSMHGTAPVTASVDGRLTGMTWSEHGIGYSLIGAVPAATLRSLADEMHRLTQDNA